MVDMFNRALHLLHFIAFSCLFTCEFHFKCIDKNINHPGNLLAFRCIYPATDHQNNIHPYKCPLAWNLKLLKHGFYHPRSAIIRWSKHGATSLFIQGHDPPTDITILIWILLEILDLMIQWIIMAHSICLEKHWNLSL
mgnify:CR=1 FL=1